MEPFKSVARWGEGTPDHVKFTPILKEFFLNELQMDPKTGLKNYQQKHSWNDFDTEPTLPQDFVLELRKIFKEEQISTDPLVRLRNSVGKSYLELLQLRMADIEVFVELVVYPISHDEVVKIIQTCNKFKIPISTVAGGTSVTLGVQAPKGSIAINLRNMNQVITINTDSLYVVSETGIFGPDLEATLNKHDVTLGHFPQSYEFSTLGGWVATRGAGQNSTLYGKIEDMLMGFKAVTGSGETIVYNKAPARATGPDWNQIFAGSEGAFGIITEVTVRVWKKPQTTKMSGFFFRTFEAGLEAIKSLLQNGYSPSIIRLYDPEETYHSEKASTLMKDPPKDSPVMRIAFRFLKFRGYEEKKRCLAIMVFEGDSDLANLTRKKAIKYAKHFGGFHAWSIPAKSWIKSRYESPYLRDHIIDYGVLLETFETSTTWENIIPLFNAVKHILKDECPVIWSHASHFYKNGANLYFHIFTPQEDKNEVTQFLRVKKKILDTFLEMNSTLSHHHGIGRAFSPWIKEAIGEEAKAQLKKMKNSLDPLGIMNPGVLFEND